MNLRIRVDDIRERGLDLERTLEVEELASILDAEPRTGFRALGPASLRVHFDRLDRQEVVAKGGFSLQASGGCRRCLSEAELPLEVAFQLDFVHADRLQKLHALPDGDDDGEGEIAGTFSSDEVDQIVYTGTEIDLAPVIREQLLLALPMDLICSEECKGLCQVCGGDMNEAACSCDRHVPDPRWAGLKDIKLS